MRQQAEDDLFVIDYETQLFICVLLCRPNIANVLLFRKHLIRI